MIVGDSHLKKRSAPNDVNHHRAALSSAQSNGLAIHAPYRLITAIADALLNRLHVALKVFLDLSPFAIFVFILFIHSIIAKVYIARLPGFYSEALPILSQCSVVLSFLLSKTT